VGEGGSTDRKIRTRGPLNLFEVGPGCLVQSSDTWAEAQQRWTETIAGARSLPEERKVSGSGHPRAGVWPVRRCATAVVSEEGRHRDYAQRDLARLVPKQ
jgi:hypothetical protein